jgi:hypothetical protein
MRPEQKELREQLNRLLLQEELKWKQRCKDTEIRQRDMNTRYVMPKPMAGIEKTKSFLWSRKKV